MQLWSRKLKRGNSDDGSEGPRGIGAYYHPLNGGQMQLLGGKQAYCGRPDGRVMGHRSDWSRVVLLLLGCTSLITFLQVWNHELCSRDCGQDTLPFPGYQTATQYQSWSSSISNAAAASSSTVASNSVGRRGLLGSAFGHLHHGSGHGGDAAFGPGRPGVAAAAGNGGLFADTLVVYIYSATDPEYEQNLRHFLREGVHEGDGCEYVFIIQEMSPKNRHMLPVLPHGSRYLFHVNDCFDWGSFGWALEEGHIQPEQYKYIILMNSSVRGPFLPAYWPRNLHWSRVLTSRITDDVKLVGPTISCEGTDATDTHPARINPHVQSYVVAMDQVAFQAMRNAQTVFQCHHTIWDTIYHAELGSAAAVLNAGYNIDSLMLRFQGLDWRDPKNWGCNGGINPYLLDHYDGMSINPLEVVFVKVKEFMLHGDWPTALMAKTYDQWSNKMAPLPVSSNRYMENLPEYAKRHVWNLRLHHPSCFDLQHYLTHNAGLPPWTKEEDAYFHLMGYGQFEGRPWRLKCDDLWDTDPSGNGKPILPDINMIQGMQTKYTERQAQRQVQQMAVERSMRVAAQQGPQGQVWGGAAGGADPGEPQQQSEQAVQAGGKEEQQQQEAVVQHWQPPPDEQRQQELVHQLGQPPPEQRQQQQEAEAQAAAAAAERAVAEEQRRLAMHQQQAPELVREVAANVGAGANPAQLQRAALNPGVKQQAGAAEEERHHFDAQQQPDALVA